MGLKPAARVLLLAFIATVTGCGSSSADEETTRPDAQQALRESAFGGLVEPMDRAAAVEQLQQDRKREIDAALEQ
jgi:hypothetical protein